MHKPALLALPVLVLSLACAPPLPAGDAGPLDGGGDAGEQGCGDVTEEGSCEGSVVTRCEDDQVTTLDCAELSGTSCMELEPGEGVDCIAGPGGTCSFEDDDGSFRVLCTGTAPACVQGDGLAVCVEGSVPCDAAAVGQCTGNGHYIAECRQQQPYQLNCVALGGSCLSQQGCGGLPEGAACDGNLYRCDAALACTDGACAEPTSADAGAADAG